MRNEKQFKQSLHRQDAYTLAEVLVTVLVVGVIVLALYAGFSSGFRVVQVTRENLRATQIMMEWMETVRLYTYTQVKSNGYVPAAFKDVYDPLGLSTNAGGTKYVAYIDRRDATNVPAGYKTNLLQFTVTVYWTNYNGNRVIPQSRQMQTFVAKPGLQNYVFSKP